MKIQDFLATNKIYRQLIIRWELNWEPRALLIKFTVYLLRNLFTCSWQDSWHICAVQISVRVFHEKFREAVHFCRKEGKVEFRGNRRVARSRNIAYRKYGRCSHVLTSVTDARSISGKKRWTLRISLRLCIPHARKIRALRHCAIYTVQWGPSYAVNRDWPTSACIIARLSTGTQTPIFDHYWTVNRDRLTRYLWSSLTRRRNRSWSEPIVLALIRMYMQRCLTGHLAISNVDSRCYGSCRATCADLVSLRYSE